MTIKKPIPRICAFDERDPDKQSLYPFPYPDGERCIAVTNGEYLHLYETSSGTTGVSLTGFAPHIEDALRSLYHALYAEPDPKRLRDAKPAHVFDIILFDRDGTGSGANTRKLLDEWSFDPDWPAAPSAVCAQILAHLPYDLFLKGSDAVDLWQRRASLKRALVNIGMANPYSDPAPVLRFMTIAPASWDWPLMGCAAQDRKHFWRQVENCFKRGYKGCLVIDVWQPWAARGDAFQLITEEDVL